MHYSYSGIYGIALKLLENNLDNQSLWVETKDERLEALSINKGVPQGPILGPLLFFFFQLF